MMELVSAGHLYIAQPPLYRIKNNEGVKWVYSDQERDDVLKNSTSRKTEVQRYKGLGEMSAEQLWETTMDPNIRTILKVNVEDAAKADEIFQMLMGGEVPPRKAFIQAHAKYATLDV